MTDPDSASGGGTGDDERRWSERLPHAARVMVVHGVSAWHSQLQDFSEGGCCLARPADCTLEEDDVVRLFFYSGDNPVVILTARVARVSGTSIGMEFHEPQAGPPASSAV